jgi:predicted DNA-binding transcriptional regulator AlpA
MNNPFSEIDARLSNIETLILDIKHQPKRSQPEAENPLNIDEVVKLTGYTKPTLYLYCQKNTIPHHKKNGRLFFFKSEIIDWIRIGKVKTLKEVGSDVDELFSNHKKGLK